MSIQPGDKLPSSALKRVDEGGFEDIDSTSLFAGRDVVLFAVPGAFTPTCSERHLPGFVEQYQAFRDKGIDVACMFPCRHIGPIQVEFRAYRRRARVLGRLSIAASAVEALNPQGEDE